MGNPSSHASHLASQWLKTEEFCWFILTPFSLHTQSTPQCCLVYLCLLFRYGLDSTDITASVWPSAHRMITEWSWMVSVSSASGGSDREQRYRPCSSSVSDVTGDAISTNQLKSHSSLSPPFNLSSFSQSCLQTLGQSCSPHWPCLFSHPHLHLEVLT